MLSSITNGPPGASGVNPHGSEALDAARARIAAHDHEPRLLPLTDTDRNPLLALSAIVHRASSEGAAILSSRVGRGWAHALRLELSAATAIAHTHSPAWPVHAELCRTREQLDMLWSFIYLLRDDGARALAHAESARRRATRPCSIELADVLRRGALWLMGDLEGFSAAPRPAFEPFKTRRRRTLETLVRGVEACVELQQLRLVNAERLVRLCEPDSPRGRTLQQPFLLPAVIKAELAYERGQLVDAESQLRELSSAIQAGGCIESALRTYRVLSRAAFHLRKAELAWVTLQEGELLAEKRGWPRLAASCIFERAQMLITLGHIEEAEGLVGRLANMLRGSPAGASPTGGNWQLATHWTLAKTRLELFKQPQAAAAASIRRVLAEVVARGDLRLGIECGVQLVEALQVLDDRAQAADVLEHMLTVSADAGLFQTVIAGGAVVRRLLADTTPQAARAPHLDVYARLLLNAWPEAIRQELPKRQAHRRGGVLTGRESSIVQLMSLGKSNKRIAQQLGIGPETVKSHAKRIFMRLGVSTRAEAVWKASRLGIV